MSESQSPVRSTEINPSFLLPIPSDPSIFIKGYTTSREGREGEEDGKRLRICSRGQSGFVPEWLFSKAVRWMKFPRARREDDPRVRFVSVNVWEFESGPVRIRAAKFENSGISMVCTIMLPNSPKPTTLFLSSIVVDDLARFVQVAASTLIHYNVEPADPHDVSEDELDWLDGAQRLLTSIHSGGNDYADEVDEEAAA